MRKGFLWLLPLLMAVFILNCDDPITNEDWDVVLSPGLAVSVDDITTSAQVRFIGAFGFTSLEADNFTITGAGAEITDVSVHGPIITITVDFGENETIQPRLFTVGISPGSTLIGGTGTVTITQAAGRAELAAGSAVEGEYTDTSLQAVFTGISGITSLETGNFTITGAGAVISGVSIDDDTVTVTVETGINTSYASRSFTVGISPDSTVIRGSETVTITQKYLENGYWVRLVNQALTPNASTTPAASGLFALVEGPTGTYSWTGTQSVTNADGATFAGTGITNGTMLYIDKAISSSHNFETKMTVNGTVNNSGVLHGVFINPASIAGTGATAFRQIFALNHRVQSADDILRHICFRPDNAENRADTPSNPLQPTGIEYIYFYRINGNGTNRNHYGMELRNTSGATLSGPSANPNTDTGGIFLQTDAQRYFGIYVLSATAVITEMKLTVN